MNNETDVNSDLLPVNRSATTHGSHQTGASTNGPATRARPAAPSGGPGHANFLQYLPFDPWRLVEALRLRWHWLAVGGSGLGLLGLVFGLATTSASYTTTVQFIRNEGQNAFQTSEFGEAFRPRPLSELAFRSMLRSQELLRRVSEQAEPPVAAKALDARLRVSPERNVDFIIVTLAGTDRQAAVNLVNLFAREAERFTKEKQADEAKEVDHYLEERLKDKEQELAAAKKQLKALSGDVQHTEPTGSMLREVLRSAETNLIELRARYTDLYPDVQIQSNKIAAIKKQLRESGIDSSQETKTEGDVVATKPKAVSSTSKGDVASGKDAEDLDTLLKRAQNRLEELEKAKLQLQSRQREARLFAQDPPGYYRLLAAATVNDAVRHSAKLKVAVLTLFSVFCGFAFAVCAALFAEVKDRRIKTAADLQRVTGLSVLAALGDLDRMSTTQQADWAFRTWTSLQDKLNHSPDHGIVCGFTSSTQGEGRSTWIRLLGQAASQRGLRVLTVATRPSPNGKGREVVVNEMPDTSDVRPQTPAADKTSPASRGASESQRQGAALAHNILSHPEQVAEQLISPDAPPVVHIPLPGWVWNYERRKEWHTALQHWYKIENVVILVELPPASVPEAVLLAEHVPQLVWLSGGEADPAQTRKELETLRHARCNLVGAVLNRETVPVIRKNLLQWMPAVAVLFALGAFTAQATDAAVADPDAPEPAQPVVKSETKPPETKPSFSVLTSRRRAPWQERFTLGPGDVLNFSLLGQKELTRHGISIGPDGRVNYLQAQDIMAAGLTVDELRAKMDEALAEYYRAPRTIITPAVFNSKKFFLLGSVVQKGVFTLDRPTTIIEAIARARGLETGLQDRNLVEIADLQRTFLVRQGHRMSVDFEKLFLRGDLSQNVPLEPDDYLYFPPADLKEVYVLGEVRTPGVVPHTPATSTLGVIAARGGFTDRAWKKRILIVRGSLNQPETFVVDGSAVLSALTTDFKLEPRDIVYVHYRPWIKAEELLDTAVSAFVQAAFITWTGGHVGPLIRSPIIE